jgi:predicted enzyme related to lactoylglutathione lyase
VPARLGHLTLDSTDVARAAAFWSAVFDGEARTIADGAFAIVAADGMPDLMIQRVDAVPGGKNPVHLDLFTADLDAEVVRLVGLGATELGRHDEFGTTWATLTDPDGFVFDLVENVEHADEPG